MTIRYAHAKINLSLVVGDRREDGLHELATVMQRIDLGDRLDLEPSQTLAVEGFAGDTIIRAALEALAGAAGVEPRWRVIVDKRIPVAAGLGGGSSDAAAALQLANETLERPLPDGELHELASRLGADVPFFLAPGPKLAEGAGERLSPVELPQDYWVLVVVPADRTKTSTGDVYTQFDALGGAPGFADRRAALVATVGGCRRPADLADLPPNDLVEAAGAPALPAELRAAGAFRADVSGAGPAVYGLFERRADAVAARAELVDAAGSWVAMPVW